MLYQLSYVSEATLPIAETCLHTFDLPAKDLTPARDCSMERVMGIEPTSSAWKAEVLPLNYTR